MVYFLTSTPQTLKYQLFLMGIDYTTLSPFELFYKMLCYSFTQKETSILFGKLDFQKFEIMEKVNGENRDICLYQVLKNGDEVCIDEYTYEVIMDYLRAVHMIEKDERIPGNEATKEMLIEDAKAEFEINKTKEYHSSLKNLISSMVNSEGFKYGHSEVWNMKINAFMDSVQRILKIKNANLLLQSGYSGFGVNLKEIDDKHIDWLGELK